MTEVIANTKGLSIYDYFGATRIKLKERCNETELNQTIVNEWTSYIDCYRKCGRADYCKYSKRHIDIRCGVLVKAIENFIQATYDDFIKMSKKQKQSFLDGAYYLTKYIIDAEMTMGLLSWDGMVRYYENHAPMVFSGVVNMREMLNRIAENFKQVKSLKYNEGILLVEGESEKIFLEKLRETRLFTFLYLKPRVYGGFGNLKTKRIAMLLERYKLEGYEIYVQLDLDGKPLKHPISLIKKRLIKKKNIFAFKRDFETSFPPFILFHVFQSMGCLKKVKLDDFVKSVGVKDMSVIKAIENIYGFSVNKNRLAEAIGNIFIDNFTKWSQDKCFWKSEIGRFIRFIQKI